ncbi:Pept_C1 domain-containing protein [Meloidogyne graminicola]|uniref:Pept_C1 domain-containing protein n=1 Tax=Meloidogyne graminicola TaxID=189291 RepID=A0A8S9ZKU3_9BILA|nr:Pept_C1 domain-containing protein [Meloidogyne graminicola]
MNILISLLLIYISSLISCQDYPDPLKEKLKDLLSEEEIEQVRELSSKIKDDYGCDLSLDYLKDKAEEINDYKNDTRGIKEVGINLFYLLPREFQDKLAGGKINPNDTDKEYSEGYFYPEEPTTTTIKYNDGYPDEEDEDEEESQYLDRKKRATCTFKNVVSSREKWPSCAQVINHVHDQGQCGSCWAFATSQTVADRRCIARAKRNIQTPDVPENIFSACDVLACSGAGTCVEGYPAKAWEWIYRTGLCTGTGFDQGCKPYTRDAYNRGIQPRCYSSCSTNWNTPYNRDKLRVNNYRWMSGNTINIQNIMNEIAANGPVVAIFQIYSDFYAHKGGVYFRSWNAQPRENHVIEIIGYGTQVCNGVETPYWLCKNSWGYNFGENGFFKIRRGTNENGIDRNQMSYCTIS